MIKAQQEIDYSLRAQMKEIEKKFKKTPPSNIIPDVTFVSKYSFVIERINYAIANAIRREVSGDLPVKVLTIEDINNMTCIDTNEEYITPAYVRMNINNIPLLQHCEIGREFTIEVQNNTLENMSVKTGSFKPAGFFNSNITLFVLRPTKYVKFTARVIEVRNKGYSIMASNVICVPVSDMYDQFTEKGPKTGVNNPTEFKFEWINSGVISNEDLLRAAIDSLIARLKSVQFNILDLSDNRYSCTATETNTIGEMISRAANELYPDLRFIALKNAKDIITLTVSCTQKIEEVIKSAIEYNLNILTNL